MKTSFFLLLTILQALPLTGQEINPPGAQSQAPQQPPQFYAVFVGVSRYGGGMHADLRFPDEDVKILAAELRLCAGDLYGAANTHIQLLNTDTANSPEHRPDKKNIETAIAEVARRAGPEDVFFLYFSGNGFVLEDSLEKEYCFLLPRPDQTGIDTSASPEHYRVSSTDIFTWLMGMQTNKKVLILESSYDGQAILDYKKMLSSAPDKPNAFPGMYILAAAHPDKSSFEAAQFGGGLLAYSFKNVLAGKALIGNKLIGSADTLYKQKIDINSALHYIYLLTQEISKKLNTSQVPMVYLSPAGRNFDLGYINDTSSINAWALNDLDGRDLPTYLKIDLLSDTSAAAKRPDRPVNLIIPNGHTRPISAFSFSPDSTLLLTGSVDKTARLWNKTRQELVVYGGHNAAIEEVAFAGNGRRVLTRSADGTVKLWALEGREILTLHQTNDMAVTGDGQYFLTAGNSNNTTLRDIDGRPVGPTFNHSSIVTQVAVSADGNTVLTYGLDDQAVLWDRAGNQISTIRIDEELGFDPYFCLSDDGKYVFYGRISDPNIYHGKCWSRAGIFIGQKGLEKSQLSALQPFYGGKTRLLFGSISFELKPSSLAFKSIDFRKGIRVGDTPFQIANPKKGPFEGFAFEKFGFALLKKNAANRAICFAPKNGSLALVGLDTSICLWNLSTNTRIPFPGVTSGVIAAEFAPDGRTVLTAGKDWLKLWDLEGHLVSASAGLPELVNARFSPDGQQILLAGYGRVEIRTRTGEKILSLSAEMDENRFFLDAALAPDAKYLITGGGNAGLWDAAGEPLRNVSLPGQFPVSAVAFSPDGGSFLTAGGLQGTAVLTDTGGRAAKILLRAKTPFSALAFSPDGGQVLVGSGPPNIPQTKTFLQPGEAFLLTAEGHIQHLLKGHTEPITAVGFHPNGRHVYTVSTDGTVRFWDRQSGQEQCTYIQLNATDWVATSPSGLFDASPGAMRSMYFVYGLEIIDLEQLKERYYEPNLLAKVLDVIPGGLRPVEEMKELPLYPAITNAVIEGDRLHVQLEARNGGIGKVSLFLGDNIELEPNANPDFKPEFDLDLTRFAGYFFPDSLNRLTLRAYNREGWFKGPAWPLKYRPTGVRDKGNNTPAPVNPKAKNDRELEQIHLYALVVGTSTFRGAQLNLKYPDKDAAAFADALRRAGPPLFGKNIDIKLLTTSADPWPRKTEIARAFQDIAAKAKPADILLVYFSGHGITYPPASEKGQFYYLTTDILGDKLDDPATLRAQAIAQDTLQSWIRQVKARKRILILDACNSGRVVEVLESGAKALNSDQRRALEQMQDRAGMFVIAGSAADKSSFEAGAFGHGLLTYSLLNNMPIVAAANKNLISVDQLFGNVREEVPRLARDIGKVQNPELIGAESFGIGMVNDTVHITVPKPRRVFVRAGFTNSQKAKDLARLSVAINTYFELRAGEKEPPLAFWNVDDFAGDYYYIGGYYQQEGVTLSGTARLYRKDEELASFPFSGSADDLEQLAETIVEQAFGFLDTK